MLCHMVLHKEGCTENNAGQENILQQLYFLYNCKKKMYILTEKIAIIKCISLYTSIVKNSKNYIDYNTK